MDTQKPDAAKPRDIIEFLREEQRRRQPQEPKPRWLVELLEEVSKPLSEEKKARLDEFMALAQEFRERVPSIAPETAESLIRQVRDEADERP